MKDLQGPVPPHYIRHNALSRYPSDWVALSVSGRFGEPNLVTWRGASAIFMHLGKGGKDIDTEVHEAYTDHSQLWADIAARAVRAGRYVVVSMTLATDIRLSVGIPWLVSHGWTMDRLNVRDDNFSGQFHLGRAKIILVDLLSWLPGSIANISKLTNVICKPVMQWSDPNDAWAAEIGKRAMATGMAWADLISWIGQDELGNWKPTGAGMAWANWRHQHYTDKVLMHGRPALMEMERLAAGTGRAEAWRHGTITDEILTDWDLTLAYPAIALDMEVPIAFSGEMLGASVKLLTHPPKGSRYLIAAKVTQSAPVLGVQVATGWIWPTGTLQGVWWDHELALAVEYGAKVEVSRVWYYRAAPALRSWAEWIFAYLYSAAPDATPVRRAAAKHFGRGLIGRFGVRYDTWLDEGRAPRPGYYTSTLNDFEADINTPAMVLGDRLYLSSGKQWGHDAIPQIMSAIMAECRVRLWRLMDIAGLEHVIYVDTDSLICDEIGSAAIEAHLSQIELWGLRPKHIYGALEIYGPRQLMADTNSKLSGVPKTAQRTAKFTFKGEVMDGMAGSMFKGGLDGIQIEAREWVLGTHDVRRRHLEEGYTAPYEATVTAKGTIIP